MDEADITGTMAKPNPGWEERVTRMAKPEYWHVSCGPDISFWAALSPDERARLDPKIALVKKAAAWMLAGMVKGTLKYPTDDRSLRQWVAHLLGEGADQMNYQLLLFAAFQAEQQGYEESIKTIQKLSE